MDPALRESLNRLGITAGNYRVLMLLPLVYVAWADGKMEDIEIERIDEIARQKLFIGLQGLEILDEWLRAPLEQAYFEQGLQDLFLLAQMEGEPLVHPEELHELLTHAEWIARSSGHALDQITAPTKDEEAALREIAEVLQLDNGMSWARLLDDLDAGPESIGRMPRSRRA